jgi:ClpP class serine protease
VSLASRLAVTREDLSMAIPTAMLEKAKEAASKIDADVYFYNGGIETPRCLASIEAIHKHRGRPKARLFLVTLGGSPDAGYKITRYFQEKYEHFTVIISGKCKSAGTLIAVGAHELAFTPYGELGPLDIQMTKVDRFDQLQSGLTIQDSLNTLEERALNKFYEIVKITCRPIMASCRFRRRRRPHQTL